MTTVRAFQASADLSEEELVDAVAKSSKSAAVGVAKVQGRRRYRMRRVVASLKAKSGRHTGVSWRVL